MLSDSKMKPYWNSLPFKNIIRVSFGICGLLILVTFLVQALLPPQVPLFYGEPVGEKQLVNSPRLAIAPIFALAIITINTLIASKIGDDFAQKVLIISSLFTSILIFITVVRIIFLVGVF